MKNILIIIFILLFPFASEDFKGKVIAVLDGDTIEVLTSAKETVRIRLNGIDCPEKKQDYGQKAKQFTASLCFNKTVTVINSGKDRYGRIIADIILPDNKVLNQELVKNGFAWHYKQYSNNNLLADLEESARKEKVGLWAGENVIAPWDWRRGERVATKPVSNLENKQFKCQGKTKCSEMSSCEEAKFYLQNCGLDYLDRDKDGVPCESICY